MQILISRFPGKVKKSDMLIGTSHRESVMYVAALCGYQIYEFKMGLRFILSLNSICKGIKLYLHEVPDIDIAVLQLYVIYNVELTQIF